MNESRIFNPPTDFVKNAAISGMDAYNKLCAEAEKDYVGFWARLAKEHVYWKQPFTKTLDESKAPFYKWFEDGTLNASENCLDRHLTTRGDQTAIIWEGDDPADALHITYKELHEQVCRFANALLNLGVTAGDRVAIYLPMIPELPMAMLACARIGAIHSVVFAGFSAISLADRINDCQAELVITSDGAPRGGEQGGIRWKRRDAPEIRLAAPHRRHLVGRKAKLFGHGLGGPSKPARRLQRLHQSQRNALAFFL